MTAIATVYNEPPAVNVIYLKMHKNMLLFILFNKMSTDRAVKTTQFYGPKERPRSTKQGRRKYQLNPQPTTEMKLSRGRWIVSTLFKAFINIKKRNTEMEIICYYEVLAGL